MMFTRVLLSWRNLAYCRDLCSSLIYQKVKSKQNQMLIFGQSISNWSF